MGGEFSKEYRRLDEVEKRLAEAKAMVESLHAAAASDAARAAAAGMPAAPGSNKARLDAAREYYQQLHDEEIAIYVCIGEHGPVQPALRGQLSRAGVCLVSLPGQHSSVPACLPAFPSTDLSRSVWPVWAVSRAFCHLPSCAWPQLLLLQVTGMSTTTRRRCPSAPVLSARHRHRHHSQKVSGAC